jgi:hypothetical protein
VGQPFKESIFIGGGPRPLCRGRAIEEGAAFYQKVADMIQGIVFSGSQIFPIAIVQFGVVNTQHFYFAKRKFEFENVIVRQSKRFPLNLSVGGSVQTAFEHSGQ